jgi:four helix bundle protein
MRFQGHELAIEAVRTLREPVDKIRFRDPDLADQLRRAANSMVLNLAEGRWRQGKDRVNRFRIAAGSASEVRACVELAVAWSLVSADAMEKPLALLDRVLAVAYRLLHPRDPETSRESETLREPETSREPET